VRRVAIAISLSIGGVAAAQTPVPVPVEQPEPPRDGAEPKPTPVPVQPTQELQPTPVPVNPAPAPTPVPQGPQSTVAPLEEHKSGPVSADLTGAAEIRKIVVEDNTKTTSETVEYISGLAVGDQWTPDMVDLVKTRLVSSGLFKDVEVYWTKEDDGVAIHILAKDKHSWVIAPAFYNQPTNVGGGIGFGENNLFGQNQKLLIYGQIATGDTFFIGAWLVRSIGGTRLYSQLDTYLKSARNIEYTSPTAYLVGAMDVRPVRESRIHYLNFGGKLGVELWRGIKIDTRIRGASVRFKDVRVMTEEGATLADIDPSLNPNDPPPAPGKEGMDVSNEWNLTIDRRANWYGIQTGHKYQLTFEHALPSLGSDFIYWVANAGAMKAVKVFERHNLVLKTNVAFGDNLPFQQELLTGGTSMRGWLNNQFRGDFRAIANLEYSVPVFTIKGFSVRALTFFDSAYTTFLKTSKNEAEGSRHYLPGAHVEGLAGLKNSVGVGTRFYLRQIVLPLLGLDFGYGLEARDYQVYLAIGLTD
jgi:outer membrane protein insertion porin family